MPKGKIPASSAPDSTLLRHISGVGPTTLCALANVGYKFTPSTTLGDFKKATGSYDELHTKLQEGGVKGGYTLPKLKMLWGKGGGSKRNREDEATMPEKKAKVGDEEVRQGDDKKDEETNFLLAPKTAAPIDEPEVEDTPKETPEIDALERKPEGAEGATPLGDIVPDVCMSVVPDVTLDVSAPDKLIADPTELLPEDPTPIIPGIAIGPNIASVRHVPGQTLEEKQDGLMLAEALPSAKANGAKDIGGDGFGSLATEAKVDEEEEEETKDAGVIIPPGQEGGRKFSVKKLDIASTPKFDEKQELQPKDMMTATRHPFKQASLFRNHDMNMKVSKLISKVTSDNHRLRAAAHQAEQNRDMSWMRYNDATQGVAMAQMPIGSTNFLSRDIMTSDYQLFGPNPLQPTFGPSPYINERLSGRFH